MVGGWWWVVGGGWWLVVGGCWLVVVEQLEIIQAISFQDFEVLKLQYP